MSELTLTIIRLALLVLLWLFIFSVLGVLRRDIYGTQISRRSERRARAQARPVPAPSPAPAAVPAGVGAAGGAHTQGTLPPVAPGIPGGAPNTPTPANAGAGAGAKERRFGRRRSNPLTLTITGGKLAGTSIPLKSSGILIGRNPECSLVLDDDYASGRHARIFAQGEQWFVEDLGSTNGTVLAGQKITGVTPIRTGSELKIGTTVLEVRG